MRFFVEFLALVAVTTIFASPHSSWTSSPVCDKASHFNFWLDGPTSEAFNSMNWWDQVNFAYNQCFFNGVWEVQVNGQDIEQIKLFADPNFMQQFDQRVRAVNGVTQSQQMSGTIDSCGWPVRGNPLVSAFSLCYHSLHRNTHQPKPHRSFNGESAQRRFWTHLIMDCESCLQPAPFIVYSVP